MYFEPLSAAKHRERHPPAQRLLRQQPMQIVEACHWMSVKANDDVTLFDSCAAGRAIAFDRCNLHRAFMREVVAPHHPPRQHNILSGKTQPRSPHAPVPEQMRDSHFCRIDRRGEADSLGRQDDRGIDADDFAAR